MLNLGFSNFVMLNRVIAVVSPDAAPIKRAITAARKKEMLVDATCGRRTRSVVFTDSGHLVLSFIMPETLLSRIANQHDLTTKYAEEDDEE